jgi:putative hydrolase of the HAD superfamily
MNETLAPLFDFCVSGEDDDVFPNQKPHAGIYQATLRRYEELFPHHDDDHVWVHVGDCLANDVGASAACGALAVWMDKGMTESSAATRLSADTNKQPVWSTASAKEL